MGKSLIKAIIIGVICWIIVGLITSLKHADVTFVQGLLKPYSIFLGAASAAGCLSAFLRKGGGG